ncbi:MAG: mandelate racemase/muconate lactonizing enzyme family protein [Candidatus Latescibacterota bacterium]|jgi:L-alanine-DL-glutamate epimerase-like enolase superfamily enzyme
MVEQNNAGAESYMKITDVQIEIQRQQLSPTPKRDAFFGRIQGAPDALAALIKHELKPLLIGQKPNMVRHLHAEMRRETEYHGTAGLATIGIAAVDTALWDCLGKERGVPCWQLWGGSQQTIRAYAMVGWLNYDDDEVQAVCARAVEQGFSAVKIKVGYPTLAEDIHRVETVRQAVGDSIGIMVDANQSLTAAEAIRRGRAFEQLGCLWWEEPIAADDIDGYSALTRALDIPIATGENLYSAADFARFLKREAVDIVQPDLRRAGGPTALLQIGHMGRCLPHPLRLPRRRPRPIKRHGQPTQRALSRNGVNTRRLAAKVDRRLCAGAARRGVFLVKDQRESSFYKKITPYYTRRYSLKNADCCLLRLSTQATNALRGHAKKSYCCLRPNGPSCNVLF